MASSILENESDSKFILINRLTWKTLSKKKKSSTELLSTLISDDLSLLLTAQNGGKLLQILR